MTGPSAEPAARAWLLLIYKVPPDPTAGRVYVWRKLKRLGAILLHDAAWVLPANPWTAEQLHWLAAEIAELSGEATVWESRLAVGDEAALVQQFLAQVESAYGELATELERGRADLAAISQRYQLVASQDYFQSEAGQRLRAALEEARGGSA